MSESEVKEPEVIEEIKRVVPDLPLSICVIGAPTSGKSAVIDEFMKLAEPYFKDLGSELVSIPNPGDTISRDFGQAMGHNGGYRDHLLAFFTRHSEELEAQSSKRSFVSSGTIIDNIAHAGIEFENVMMGAQNSGLVTPGTEQEMQKIQAAMATMTFLMIDTFRYNFAFYLPLQEKVVIPGKEEDSVEDRHAKRVDAAIQSIFENFSLGIQRLDQGTAEDKAQVMFDTISGIMTDGYVVTPVVEEPIEEELELPEFPVIPDLPEDSP